MKKIYYEEWLQNLESINWHGWQEIKELEKTVTPSRSFPTNWLAHAVCFLNNYLLEKTVYINLKSMIKGFEYVLPETHLAWCEGKGSCAPDFVDANGLTYELKQMKDFSSLSNIPDYDWHNADIRLIYNRIAGELYKIDMREYEPKIQFMFYFRPLRIDYKTLAVSDIDI